MLVLMVAMILYNDLTLDRFASSLHLINILLRTLTAIRTLFLMTDLTLHLWETISPPLPTTLYHINPRVFHILQQLQPNMAGESDLLNTL